MSSGNKLVSHTSIYMLGDVLRYSVSLVMLPIYTRYLTPADYGVVELLINADRLRSHHLWRTGRPVRIPLLLHGRQRI